MRRRHGIDLRPPIVDLVLHQNPNGDAVASPALHAGTSVAHAGSGDRAHEPLAGLDAGDLPVGRDDFADVALFEVVGHDDVVRRGRRRLDGDMLLENGFGNQAGVVGVERRRTDGDDREQSREACSSSEPEERLHGIRPFSDVNCSRIEQRFRKHSPCHP